MPDSEPTLAELRAQIRENEQRIQRLENLMLAVIRWKANVPMPFLADDEMRAERNKMRPLVMELEREKEARES